MDVAQRLILFVVLFVPYVSCCSDFDKCVFGNCDYLTTVLDVVHNSTSLDCTNPMCNSLGFLS